MAARQHGLIRIDQLGACGLDGAAVARRVRKGSLHRVHVGVYAVGYVPQTLHEHFMAAVLAAGDDGFLSHWTSCALAGLVRWERLRIDVTVHGSAERRRAAIRFHRALAGPPGRHSTASRRRRRPGAILEIAPQLSEPRLKRLVRKAQAERLASVQQLADVLRRANGHAATARIAAIIATGAAATASGHEDLVLDLILQAGLEHPVVNARLAVGGRPYHPDLRWPAQRLSVAIDSSLWHDGALAQELDADSQADLEAAGERVLRTTREQAMRDPQQLVARLVAAEAPLHRKSPPPASYTQPQR